MIILEHEGKELFAKYGIPVPAGKVITRKSTKLPITLPVIIKSQIPTSDRGRRGGVLIAKDEIEFNRYAQQIFMTEIDGHLPEKLLVEPLVTDAQERYISISYSTDTRSPVLAINAEGGVGTDKAILITIDPYIGIPSYLARQAVVAAGLSARSPVAGVIQKLWKLFSSEKVLLAEINPLFETADGQVVAGDAKVMLDDSLVRPEWRPHLDLGGDIAVLASGGGASMINLDALMRAGGRPANYVEYSGNPKSGVVTDLTVEVLSKPNLKGCWVIGGTANFTDIYETMKGFLEGLEKLKEKPTYPFVIRRDGPRREEAFAMLAQFAKDKGYDFHLYGPDTPMSASAKTIVKLAYKN